MRLQEHLTRLDVEHVSVRSDRPFSDVIARLEARTGVFDLQLVESHLRAGSAAATLAAIDRMAGTSGFMRFARLDHGTNLRLHGHAAEALRYLIGHPQIAAQMTARKLTAGLYAPLSLLVAGATDATWLEYDRPSSLLRAFADHEVTRVAEGLDEKLSALVQDVAA